MTNMKRRAFISKTALAAIAAPFLPTALAKASTAVPAVTPQTKPWVCVAKWKTGMAGLTGVATLVTDSFDEVLEFINHHGGEDELKLSLNGKVVFRTFKALTTQPHE